MSQIQLLIVQTHVYSAKFHNGQANTCQIDWVSVGQEFKVKSLHAGNACFPWSVFGFSLLKQKQIHIRSAGFMEEMICLLFCIKLF